MSAYLILAFIVVVTVICLSIAGLLIYFLFPFPTDDADDPYSDEFPGVSAPREPDHVGTFTNIRLPVSAVVERCDVTRAARVLREHTSPNPSSEAAE